MSSIEKPQPEPNEERADRSSTSTGAQADASARLYSDARDTDSTNGNSRNGSAEAGSLRTNDDTNQSNGGSDSLSEMMAQEAQDAWKAASNTFKGVSKLIGQGISPEIARRFGDVSFFDSTDSDSGDKLEAAKRETTESTKHEGGERTQDSEDERRSSTEFVDSTDATESRESSASRESRDSSDTTELKTGEGAESTLMNSLSDLGSWASETFKDYVVKPVSNLINDVTNVFDSAGEWMFDKNDQFASADKLSPEVASLNDARNEFNEAFGSARSASQINFNGASDASEGAGLTLPADAIADGTVEIGGQKITVMRTPDGDTFLKKGDKVIAQQREDGSYKVALKDGSTLDLKMSEGADGKYNLDKMERYKGDKLQQKLEDGVLYNYNYDAQGNRTRVDAAAADLKGPLSQERLDKIKAELGDSGAAALRVRNEDGSVSKLLLQSHDAKTQSLTDVDKKRAQIFHDGKEYRLNDKDQLALVGPNGADQPVAQDEQDPRAEETNKRLRDLSEKVRQRARGERTDVDGVGVNRNDDGSIDITLRDPETGEPQGKISLPKDNDNPIKMINSANETITLNQDGGLNIKDGDGFSVADFDRLTGFNNGEVKIDRTGLESLEDGTRINPDGSVVDANGQFISTLDGTEWWNEELCEDTIEHRENSQLSKETAHEVSTLGNISLSISRSGNPAVMSVAKSIAQEAFGVANAALGQLGNDILSAVPVQLSLSVAQTALTQASRSERTQTYAMRMGISDTTRLSEFNRLGTLTSTTFSPEEFVRDRLKAA